MGKWRRDFDGTGLKVKSDNEKNADPENADDETWEDTTNNPRQERRPEEQEQHWNISQRSDKDKTQTLNIYRHHWSVTTHTHTHKTQDKKDIHKLWQNQAK